MKSALKRGEVARQAGVNIETLRFYERLGVIAPPPRLESGHRAYPPETVEIVMFIKGAQELGFTLQECLELLSLTHANEGQCESVQAVGQRKLALIRNKIEDLRIMESALVSLLRACSKPRQALVCPILESFSRGRKRRRN